MGTTTEELKKLYAKLGGTDPNIPKASTPGEVLNGINELELGGDKLPEVTEADNGKALGVKQGQWDKMDVDIELPDVTTDDNGKVLMVSEGNWGKGNVEKGIEVVMLKSDLCFKDSDMTVRKLRDLCDEKIVFLRTENTTILYHYYGHAQLDWGSNRDSLVFFSYVPSLSPYDAQSESHKGRSYTLSMLCADLDYGLSGNRMVMYHKSNVMTLPKVTSSDNGNVLSVVNGYWEKANLPTELPAVTASDNGSILSVVDGAWAKGNLPSGNSIVWLEGSKNGPSSVMLNKTAREVIDILKAGNLVGINFSDMSMKPLCSMYFEAASDASISFSAIVGNTVYSFKNEAAAYGNTLTLSMGVYTLTTS